METELKIWPGSGAHNEFIFCPSASNGQADVVALSRLEVWEVFKFEDKEDAPWWPCIGVQVKETNDVHTSPRCLLKVI
jgi:hypothetical protein